MWGAAAPSAARGAALPTFSHAAESPVVVRAQCGASSRVQRVQRRARGTGRGRMLALRVRARARAVRAERAVARSRPPADGAGGRAAAPRRRAQIAVRDARGHLPAARAARLFAGLARPLRCRPRSVRVHGPRAQTFPRQAALATLVAWSGRGARPAGRAARSSGSPGPVVLQLRQGAVRLRVSRSQEGYYIHHSSYTFNFNS